MPNVKVVKSVPNFAWAAMSPTGLICTFTGAVDSDRSKVMALIPQAGLAASDYERLGPKRGYRKCYRAGWRVIRVRVTQAFSGSA